MPTLPRGSISGPPQAAADEHTSSALQAGPQADAAAAAAAAAATPAVAAAPYVTSRMEAEAAAQGRPIPTLCCPDCGKTRKVELISQQTGAPKIRYISGPTYVSTHRNKVQKCSCKECGVFFLSPHGGHSQHMHDALSTLVGGAHDAVPIAMEAPVAGLDVQQPLAVGGFGAFGNAEQTKDDALNCVTHECALPGCLLCASYNVNNGGGAGTVGAAAGDGAGESTGGSTTEDVEMRNVESSHTSFVRPPDDGAAATTAASASAVVAAAAPAVTAAPPAAPGHGRICRELSTLMWNPKAPAMHFSVGSKVQGKWGALRGGTQWLQAVVVSTGSCTYDLKYEDDGRVETNVAPRHVRAASREGHTSQVSAAIFSGEVTFDDGTGRLPRLAQLHGKRLRLGSFIGEVVSTRQRANRDSRVGILWRQAWAADPRCKKCRKCASCPDLGDGSLTFEDDLSVQDVLTRLRQQSEGVVYPSERYPEKIRQGTSYQAAIPAITVGVSEERNGDKERLAGLVETVIEVASSMERPRDAVEEVLRALRALVERMSCSRV